MMNWKRKLRRGRQLVLDPKFVRSLMFLASLIVLSAVAGHYGGGWAATGMFFGLVFYALTRG